MKYRKLGRTEISVSEIGLGTEYLNGQSFETISSVTHKATDTGVNYIDVLFSFPEYRTDIGNALKGRRDKVIIAGHTGCAMTELGVPLK
jgi:aryl-alcohol dehydrogenase-like predicted oxidoreductase